MASWRGVAGGVAVFKVGVSGGITAAEPNAPAFLVPSGGCVYQGHDVNWYFEDNYVDGNGNHSTPWTAALQSDARDGIEGWLEVRREGAVGSNLPGNPMLYPHEVAVGTPGAFRVVRIDGAGGGSTSCADRVIKIDVSDNDYRIVAAHEMGHAYGLKHTGTKDQLTTASAIYDLGTQVPLMGSCIRSSGSSSWRARSDDQAAAWHAASGSVAADGGFESSSISPRPFRMGGSYVDSGYSYAGNSSMRLPPSSYFEQRVRASFQPMTGVTANVRYKTSSGTDTTFKLQVRRVSYDPSLPQNCNNGVNGNQLNMPTPESQWTWSGSSAFLSPGSTWTFKSIALSVNITGANQGADIDLFVNNQNTSQTLWVDSAEVKPHV